jgi:hypothetical protein
VSLVADTKRAIAMMVRDRFADVLKALGVSEKKTRSQS